MKVWLTISVAVLGLTHARAQQPNYAQRLFEESLARQRAVMGETANDWTAFQDVMARLEPFLEQNAQGDREAMRNEPDNDAAGLGMTTIYKIAREENRRNYEAERQRALSMLHELREAGMFEITGELPSIAVSMPPLENEPLDFTIHKFASRARALARIQFARMRVAEGDDAERLAALSETLALARLVAWNGSILDWLVGKSMAQEATGEFLLSLLLYPATSDEALEQADRLIALEGIQRPPSFDLALLAGKYSVLDLIERTHDRNGRFVRNDVSESALMWVDESEFEAPFASRDELSAWMDDLCARIQAAADATGEQAIGVFDSVRDLYESHPNSPLAEFAPPPNIVLIEQDTRIDLIGARVVIAVERYRLRHDGTLPDSLEDLGPLLPEEVRTDPLSRTPWVYAAAPMTADVENRPLGQGAVAWPYSLRSAPLPGLEPAAHHRLNPNRGVPITRSIPAPLYDRP